MDTPGIIAATAEEAEVVSPGTRVGRWVVGDALGRGASATVYAVKHADLGREAALKVLHEGARFSAEARARFLREGRAAAAVSHPNAVAVLDVAVHDGMPCLVMERVGGETLGALLSREGVLPVARALALLLPLCDAVAMAHRSGVVHRDIKPSNIAVVRQASREGVRPVLLDFGAARLLVEGDDDLTRSRALLGTPAYMAPEQARAARAATPACDQFALAAVLLQMVSGALPYRGDRWTECFAAAVRGEVQDVARVAPSLPGDLVAVLRRGLSADPARRYASVEEFARALRPFAVAGSGPPRVVSRRVLVVGLMAVSSALIGLAWAQRGGLSPSTPASPSRVRPGTAQVDGGLSTSSDAGAAVTVAAREVVVVALDAGVGANPALRRSHRRRRAAPTLGPNEAPILDH